MNPEQRRKIFREIQCTPGCGNCCPTTCCEFNASTRTCNAHPTLVGGAAADLRRGQGCGKTTPIIAFTYGYYCPPVIERIKQELPELHIEQEVTPHGVVMMKNMKQIWERTESIRGYPKEKHIRRKRVLLNHFPFSLLNFLIHSK